MDAAEYMDALTSLNVELTERQVAWLRRRADQQGLSLDHVLRSIITEHLRRQRDEMIGDPPRETGASTGTVPSNSSGDGEDRSTIVESLRSASRRLDDLTHADTVEELESDPTLSGLQQRLDEMTSEQTTPEPENDRATDDGPPSMFELMDDE